MREARELSPEMGITFRIKSFLHDMRLRPNTGRLWQDVLNLLVIFFIQNSIIPTFLSSAFAIDLVTPWLVISFVRQKLFPSSVLALVGGLAIEMHSAAPAGIYLCVYWILANVIFQIKPTISWRMVTPWLFIYAVSSVWVMLFESFMSIFTRGLEILGGFFFVGLMVRLGVAVLFGFILCRPWLEFREEEIINL